MGMPVERVLDEELPNVDELMDELSSTELEMWPVLTRPLSWVILSEMIFTSSLPTRVCSSGAPLMIVTDICHRLDT